jgi:two-component system response regulator YesN
MFRASFGCPFGEYLTKLRLERAEQLLHDTDWRISRIAEHVGFESFSYFSKRFREAMGMTPSEYRRHERET